MGLEKYMKILVFIFISVSLFSYETGFIKKVYKDTQRERTLYTNIYYPTVSNIPSILIGDNAVFEGIHAKENAEIYDGKFPLIILIHGSGGNNTSLNYLVESLVSKGIIVVAANHERRFDGDSEDNEAVQVWIQNEDVSFLLDEVLRDENIKTNILLNKIGVIGFSKGAYTAVAKAGGELELEKFSDYCRLNSEMPDCIFFKSENIDLSILDKEKFENSYLDKRFSYAVSIDPSLGSSFKVESLKSIKIPILLILGDFYSVDNKEISLLGNEIYKNLNKKISYQKKIKNSGHFSFLPECKREALKILEYESKDDAVICKDGSKLRNEVHKETIDYTLKFLKEINVLTK